MSARGSKEARLVLGASPRVDLLPPEVADRKKGAALRRAIILGMVGAVVVSGAGYVYASWQALDAASKSDAASAQTAALLTEQGKYSQIRTLTDELAIVGDARQVGALTEISWTDLYNRIMPTVPADMTVTSLTFESSTPLVSLAVGTSPWAHPRTADVALVATTANFASAQTWIVALKNLPDYGGAVAGSIGQSEGSLYTVNVTLDLTQMALSKRFQPAPDPAATETPAAVVEGSN